MSRSAKYIIAAVVVAFVLGGSPAHAYTPGNNATPAPFAVAPDSVDATGLTLRRLDLRFPIEAIDGSQRTVEEGAKTEVALSADVLFEFGKSDLTPAANALLDDVGRRVSERTGAKVTITGYTDSIGSDAVNIPLSQARAQSVATALTARTQRSNFIVEGKGSTNPIAPNTKPDGTDNPEGRAKNRRVSITLDG